MTPMNKNKIVNLSTLVDGASLALGGSFLHRGPFAFVRELIRQKKRGLETKSLGPVMPGFTARSIGIGS
jgi:glutaconate CoA-transferase subunit A